jgi:hypothetical protein
MAEPELLAKNEEAHKRAAAVKETATSLTVKTGTVMGEVTIDPGTIWSGYNKMIVTADGFGVVYMNREVLYRQGVSDFIRDELISAFEKAGQSAKPWIKIAKTEFKFICGLFVPWYGSIGIFAAEIAIFYHQNKSLTDEAFEHGRKVMDRLLWVRSKCPTLFDKLMISVGRILLKEWRSGSVEALTTSENIAHFIGRILRGAKGTVEETGVLTIKALIKTILIVAIINGTLNIPGIVIASAKIANKTLVEKIILELSFIGAPTLKEEAIKISIELMMNPEETKKNLTELYEASQKLIPILEKLAAKIKEDF